MTSPCYSVPTPMSIQAAQGPVCVLTFKKEMRGFERMKDGPRKDKDWDGREI